MGRGGGKGTNKRREEKRERKGKKELNISTSKQMRENRGNILGEKRKDRV